MINVQYAQYHNVDALHGASTFVGRLQQGAVTRLTRGQQALVTLLKPARVLLWKCIHQQRAALCYKAAQRMLL